ncbi:unnamed protein product [Meloidogyne enterolobii]|uniref:Uncharacterized protein n=1 Tax=Meloidogyne enterolobii TaxID=390850 RepID=A0ACB1B1C4_MELEN
MNTFPSTTTSSSLFGAQPTTSSSLFGAKPANSLFGTNPSTQTGNLFGSQPSTGFGSTAGVGILGANKPAAFGQVSQSNLFGQQPQQPGGGLFNSASSVPPTFGATTTTASIFGANNTGSSFGGFGQQQPQPTQIGGSLFGSPKPVQPSFSSFGGNQQPTQTFAKFTPPSATDTMQLKGSQQQVQTKQMCISAMKEYETKSLEEIRCNDYIGGRKVNTSVAPTNFAQPQGGVLFSKPGTGLFSTVTTTTPATSSSLFGAQPTTSSSIFGAKPANSLFGTNPSTQTGNLFGSQPSTGFGSTAGVGILGANKPAAFGQVSQSNLFGQQPQQPGGGLFNSASSVPPTFGATTTTASIFGANNTGSSFGGFGQQQPQPTQIGGSLFGSPKPVQPSFSSFGGNQQPTQTFANTQQGQTLLGSNLNTSAFQKEIIESQLSSLPYGDSPLLKVSTSPRKSAQDIISLSRQIIFGTKDDQQKFTTTSSQNSFLADLSISTISKGINTYDKENSIAETFDTSLGYKPLIILPSVGFGTALGLRHEPKLTKSFASEKSFISGKSTSLHLSFAEDDTKRIKSLDMSVVFEPSPNEDNSFIADKSSQVNSVLVPLQLSPSMESERPTIEEIQSPPEKTLPPKEPIQQNKQQQQNTQQLFQQPQQKKFKMKLSRPEYYSNPLIEDLEALFDSKGICKIEGGLTIGRLGYGSVFWRGPIELQEPLDLDEIVHFRNKEVVVYPDESKKPEIGRGLNKPAEVSLENVWPIDPKTKMPIKDTDELIRMNFKGKLERLCARMDAHFVDYQPSRGVWIFQVEHFSKYGFHDEDDDEDIIAIQQQEQQQMDVDKIHSAHLQNLIQKAKVPLREIQKTFDGNKNNKNKREYLQQQTTGFVDNRGDFAEYNEDDSKLFQDQIICKKLRFDDTLFDSSKLLNIVTNKEQQQGQICPQKFKLVERLPKYIYSGLDSQNLSKSFLKKCGINFLLPSCKIGFSQDLVFAAIPPSTHLNVVNIYQTRVIVPTVKNFFLQYIRQNNLNLQKSLENLELTQLVKFDPPSPILSYLDKYLTESFINGKDLNKSFDGICKILLMDLKTIEDKISQRILMGDWLCEQLSIEDNNKTTNNKKPFLKIFKFLINGQIEKAAEYAKEQNLFNLALLLSLYKCPSVGLVRNMVAKQLSISFKQTNVDKDYIKILQLLSGEFKNCGEYNNFGGGGNGCLEGLNWLQILGILIWYHASPTTTMIECLDILQELV